MALRENASCFLADFGETVTLNGVQVEVLFEVGYAVHSLGDAGMSTSVPTLTLPTASVPADPVGKLATVRGVTYDIAEARPDGTASGFTVLVLERNA